MSRIYKLYQKALDRRSLTFAEFQALILAFGFTLDRINGSHHIFRKEGVPDRVNAQPKGKESKPYQVRQFLDMIEEYGLNLGDDT